MLNLFERRRTIGQYWYVVNLDKREFVSPHKLGAGMKLIEQLGAHPGTGGALLVLLAAMPENRGGGDFDLDQNWHGPERTLEEHSISPGPMPEDYPTVARRTIGRWAGDRIALVGDYAEDGDLLPTDVASEICAACSDGVWTDVSEDVCRVIEHELRGKFSGEGWRHFELLAG